MPINAEQARMNLKRNKASNEEATRLMVSLTQIEDYCNKTKCNDCIFSQGEYSNCLFAKSKVPCYWDNIMMYVQRIFPDISINRIKENK